MRRKELARAAYECLSEAFPDAECTLDRDLPERLAVRGILSAQCTDERVNITSRDLFEAYPDMRSLAEADAERIGEIIRPCGLHNSKSRSVKAFAEAYVNEWGGVIPCDAGELMKIPGIGRKIANLIVGEVYQIPAIVVDTHMKRVARRIGLTKETDPLKVEADLNKVVPEECMIRIGHLAVELGRSFCRAQSPDCAECPLTHICRKVL